MSLNLSRVLLVDDNEEDYILVSDLLSGITGRAVPVEWVSTYEAAHDALCQKQYDVCLLDCCLGGHTGLELLQELSGGQRPPHHFPFRC